MLICCVPLQVPDWHPGVPSANQEIYDPTTWVANMINWYKTLVTAYPGVVGKLIVDLVNVSPCPDLHLDAKTHLSLECLANWLWTSLI